MGPREETVTRQQGERVISDTEADTGGVIALIPAYNEGSRVADVVTHTLKSLPVLVVDDGSSDDTASQAEAAGATVHRYIPNQGKGVALQAGFRQAMEMGKVAVITLDADGQHDPDEIPIFLKCYADTGADLIIGARDFEAMPGIRRLGNTLGRKAFSWALGQEVQDNQSGYRLIGRDLMQAMVESREAGFEFEVEMIVTCVRLGYRLEWVPISTIYAGESSHINPVTHVANFLRLVWNTRQATRT